MRSQPRFHLLSRLFAFAAVFFVALAQAESAEQEVFGTAPDGTQLQWVVDTPATPGPWPTILVIHGGGFKGGGPGSGALCARDLAAAGYLALSIEYRLAPNGSLPGQVSDGRFPQQSDDVKMAVRAARSDPRCNGQVGAVGGSAGGYHTAFVAATGSYGDDRIDVGVSLSGAYDFSDSSPDPGLNPFIQDATNYVGVPASDTAALRAASPVSFVDATVAPLFLINSAQDPMPISQLADMTAKLDSLGVRTYQTLTLAGSLHAFDYWATVKDEVIAFLGAHFSGVPTPTPTPAPPPAEGVAQLLNVSTRAHVGSGDRVMIGGFIIRGALRKEVVLRALGPSLTQAGVQGVLADPVLALYNSAGHLIAKNDNSTALPQNLVALGLKPGNPSESIISVTLVPGSYTAVLSGAGNSSGAALLELYDLSPTGSTLSNISTRGEVVSNDDPIIGGFIAGGTKPAKVIVRAIGPSLALEGVTGAISNPVLELRNSDGSLLFANDNWRSDQEQQVLDTTIPPRDDRESAIVATLAPGNYTAIVRDSAGASGVALVEVYNLPND
ncbi:MAG: DVUA0089 family protein [Chthoniobacterales bacterium]|nr:DVUA0089 family protein [Chthoniobacterales bacterium]